MLESIELPTHYFVMLIILLKPVGVKEVAIESITMKHQLIILNRLDLQKNSITFKLAIIKTEFILLPG